MIFLGVGVKAMPTRKTDNLVAICELIVYKMWYSRRLTSLWASTASYKDNFAFFILMHLIFHVQTVSNATIFTLILIIEA
jgi:hypothetical protein